MNKNGGGKLVEGRIYCVLAARPPRNFEYLYRLAWLRREECVYVRSSDSGHLNLKHLIITYI